MMIGVYFVDRISGRTVIVAADKEPAIAADGDSFAIGQQKFRLKGIDAPELHQLCKDESGSDWACEQAARGALVTALAEPSLRCATEAHDRYHRALATCNNARSFDIAADQVRAGMAISSDFYGIRSYSGEEDDAKAAKRGMWRGTFDPPSQWRAAHPR